MDYIWQLSASVSVEWSRNGTPLWIKIETPLALAEATKNDFSKKQSQRVALSFHGLDTVRLQHTRCLYL